jgi:hypothetical protein
MMRTAVNDPARFAARYFIYGAAPMAAMLAWNSQNPYYSDISAREKDYYWIIMKGRKSKDYYKLAKGHGIRLIISPLQLMLENYLTKSAHVKNSKLVMDLVTGIAPVDDPSALFPPLLKILGEQLANYDMYWDRDIVRDKSLPKGWQADPWTSETLKSIGRGLRIPPARMQHILTGMMGGSAGNMLLALDVAVGLTTPQKMPELRADRLPFVRRVYGQTETWKSDIEQRLRVKVREIRDMKKSKRSIGYKELRTKEKSGDQAYEDKELRSAYKRQLLKAQAEYYALLDAREANLKLRKKLESKIK